MRREVLEHGRAVSVLAYDPERRTALLVRKFRAPVFLAGGETLLFEAIAGMIDGGDAAETARREAKEEAGLQLGDLEPVGDMWASPGVMTERIALFLAPYRLRDRVSAGGGLAEEHEDIEVVEMPLRDLTELTDQGKLADMKTLALITDIAAAAAGFVRHMTVKASNPQRRSMCKEDRQRRVRADMRGCTAEHAFAQRAAAIGAHDKEIRTTTGRILQQSFADLA